MPSLLRRPKGKKYERPNMHLSCYMHSVTAHPFTAEFDIANFIRLTFGNSNGTRYEAVFTETEWKDICLMVDKQKESRRLISID